MNTKASTTASTTKKPPRQAITRPVMVPVTLVREHEHQGERKPAGAQISVHPETARWLSDQGVISNSPKD